MDLPRPRSRFRDRPSTARATGPGRAVDSDGPRSVAALDFERPVRHVAAAARSLADSEWIAVPSVDGRPEGDETVLGFDNRWLNGLLLQVTAYKESTPDRYRDMSKMNLILNSFPKQL